MSRARLLLRMLRRVHARRCPLLLGPTRRLCVVMVQSARNSTVTPWLPRLRALGTRSACGLLLRRAGGTSVGDEEALQTFCAHRVDKDGGLLAGTAAFEYHLQQVGVLLHLMRFRLAW